MAKIQISFEGTKLGVLTYRGLECEMMDGMPVNWARLFIAKGSEKYPEYNHVQYLRNVNIQAYVPGNPNPSADMPAWHAAVVLLDDNTPKRLLLVSETRVLDALVQRFPPLAVIQQDYPAVDATSIRVGLIDGKESPIQPITANMKRQRVEIIKGWPSKEYQDNCAAAKEQAQQVAAAAGGVVTSEIVYRMKMEQFNIDLRFKHCLANDELIVLIIGDDVNPEEAW